MFAGCATTGSCPGRNTYCKKTSTSIEESFCDCKPGFTKSDNRIDCNGKLKIYISKIDTN